MFNFPSSEAVRELGQLKEAVEKYGNAKPFELPSADAVKEQSSAIQSSLNEGKEKSNDIGKDEFMNYSDKNKVSNMANSKNDENSNRNRVKRQSIDVPNKTEVQGLSETESKSLSPTAEAVMEQPQNLNDASNSLQNGRSSRNLDDIQLSNTKMSETNIPSADAVKEEQKNSQLRVEDESKLSEKTISANTGIRENDMQSASSLPSADAVRQEPSNSKPFSDDTDKMFNFASSDAVREP